MIPLHNLRHKHKKRTGIAHRDGCLWQLPAIPPEHWQKEVDVMSSKRTELQMEVVDALIQSKAFDFEAVGKVLGKYGSRAALTGDAIGVIINWRVLHYCIPPYTVDRFRGLEGEQFTGSTAE